MSFPVENIRALCKKRGTSLAALERSFGFGNGVIAGWETAKIYPPYDRVSAVAAALGVSIEELTGKKAPASVSESGRPYVDLDTKMIWAPAPASFYLRRPADRLSAVWCHRMVSPIARYSFRLLRCSPPVFQIIH